MKKFIGIDLHSNAFTCCFLYEGVKKQHIRTFPVDPKGFNDFAKFLDKETYMTVEASTNSFSFAKIPAITFKTLLVVFKVDNNCGVT